MFRGASDTRDEARFLRHETYHRLQNSFAVISAVLRREAETPASEAKLALERCNKMLMAHSDLYRCLMVSAGDEWLSTEDYISDLCFQLSRAVLEPLKICCWVSASAGNMRRDQCEKLGLIVCELVMNAAKHAFPKASGGRVEVELTARAGGWLCSVRDNGVGWSPSVRLGAGSKIISGLVDQLQAELFQQSSSAGTSISVLIPQSTTRGNMLVD
jgi:two-component sensor histidine kinase